MNIVIYLTQWLTVDGLNTPDLPAGVTAYSNVTGGQIMIPEPNAVVVGLVCDNVTLALLDPDGILISEAADTELYGEDYATMIEAVLNG